MMIEMQFKYVVGAGNFSQCFVRCHLDKKRLKRDFIADRTVHVTRNAASFGTIE